MVNFIFLAAIILLIIVFSIWLALHVVKKVVKASIHGALFLLTLFLILLVVFNVQYGNLDEDLQGNGVLIYEQDDLIFGTQFPEATYLDEGQLKDLKIGINPEYTYSITINDDFIEELNESESIQLLNEGNQTIRTQILSELREQINTQILSEKRFVNHYRLGPDNKLQRTVKKTPNFILKYLKKFS
jgi:energy-coupling factor transporter transmembrane protein EcfT